MYINTAGVNYNGDSWGFFRYFCIGGNFPFNKRPELNAYIPRTLDNIGVFHNFSWRQVSVQKCLYMVEVGTLFSLGKDTFYHQDSISHDKAYLVGIGFSSYLLIDFIPIILDKQAQ